MLKDDEPRRPGSLREMLADAGLDLRRAVSSPAVESGKGCHVVRGDYQDVTGRYRRDIGDYGKPLNPDSLWIRSSPVGQNTISSAAAITAEGAESAVLVGSWRGTCRGVSK